MKNGIWQSFMLDIVNINVHANFYQHIPRSSKVMGPVSLVQYSTSVKPQPATNVIW